MEGPIQRVGLFSRVAMSALGDDVDFHVVARSAVDQIDVDWLVERGLFFFSVFLLEVSNKSNI